MMKFNSRRVRAALALGSVLGIGTVGTLAAYTDTARFSSTFTTGSVDIVLNGTNQGNPTAYEFSAWSAANMAGGATVYAPLTVRNNGTINFSYTMSEPTFAASDSAELRTLIQAGVRIAATCDAAGYAAGSTIVADGNLSQLQITAPRTLAVGAEEVLCFRAGLPSEAPNASQASTVTPTFTLTATQAP